MPQDYATLAYAALVSAGGIGAYVSKKSVPSLVSAVSCGIALVIAPDERYAAGTISIPSI